MLRTFGPYRYIWRLPLLIRLGLSATPIGIVIAQTVLAPLRDGDLPAAAEPDGRGARGRRLEPRRQPVGVMRHVVVPFCAPAIVSALCLTAAVSFDEVIVAWFVSGRNRRVPVMILEILQGNVDPQINGIGAVICVTSRSTAANSSR